MPSSAPLIAINLFRFYQKTTSKETDIPAQYWTPSYIACHRTIARLSRSNFFSNCSFHQIEMQLFRPSSCEARLLSFLISFPIGTSVQLLSENSKVSESNPPSLPKARTCTLHKTAKIHDLSNLSRSGGESFTRCFLLPPPRIGRPRILFRKVTPPPVHLSIHADEFLFEFRL